MHPRRGLTLRFEAEARKLRAIRYEIDDRTLLVVESKDGHLEARREELPYVTEVRGVAGTVERGLWQDLTAAGAPDEVAAALSELFGWEFDLEQLQAGDRFRGLYENIWQVGSKTPSTGKILAASLESGGRNVMALLHEDEDGHGGYYTAEGKALGRYFLRYPVEFTKISSVFSFVVAERLLDVVEGALVHGLHGGLERGLRRHEDHRHVGVLRLGRREHLDTGDLRHAHVAEHDVGRELLELLEGGLAAMRDVRGEPLGAQQDLERLQDARLVVHDEDGRGRGTVGHVAAPSGVVSRGRRTVKQVPVAALSTRVRPRCAYDRAMHHRQPEAAAAGLGGGERLEEPVGDLGRDPGAAVADLDRVRLIGIRKGILGHRFPDRTEEQFMANEAFIRSAYPGATQ